MGCRNLSYGSEADIPVYRDYETGEGLEKSTVFSRGAYKKGGPVQKKCVNYYPFGLQHGNSWTRPTSLKNNFLFNAGSELNEVTGNYETFYRNYDPVLGRFNAIDPLASSFSNLTPYNFALNDPVFWNDGCTTFLQKD